MAQWSVKPEWKKSVIERQTMIKDGNSIVIETGWRWGEFLVYTDDDNPPQLEAGVDMFNCGYESEMIIDCDLIIERLDDDGNPTGEIVGKDDSKEETTEAIQLKPGAPWPFENATETAKFKCESCDFTTEDIMDLEETDDENKGAYVCPECGGKVDLG